MLIYQHGCWNNYQSGDGEMDGCWNNYQSMVVEKNRRLDLTEAITHMQNGGQVSRIVSQDRFFYKIEGGVLLCRCNNELGGWYPAATPLCNKDLLYVADIDYKRN